MKLCCGHFLPFVFVDHVDLHQFWIPEWLVKAISRELLAQRESVGPGYFFNVPTPGLAKLRKNLQGVGYRSQYSAVKSDDPVKSPRHTPAPEGSELVPLC